TLGTQGNFNQPITGLAEGTTYSYQAYLYNGTTYTYGGVQTFTTTVQSVNNVANPRACLTDNEGTISSEVPTGGATPTGYMVFAVEATSYGVGTLEAYRATEDYLGANTNFNLATTYGTLGKL